MPYRGEYNDTELHTHSWEAPKPFWVFLRTEKDLVPGGIESRFLDYPARNPVTILTELPKRLHSFSCFYKYAKTSSGFHTTSNAAMFITEITRARH